MPLFNEFIHGVAQVINGVVISGGNCIDHTMPHMIFEDHFAGIVQCRANSSQLHQYFGAVVAFFYHFFYFFQVTQGPGQPIDNGLLIFVNMAVAVGDAMGMQIGVVVFVIVVVVGHLQPSFLFFSIILYFASSFKSWWGEINARII